MSITKEELIINKHIDELRERMNVLQNDRKANAEMYEESKRRNVEEMKRLKEENHDFRSKIAILQRTLVEASDQDEQRHLEGEVDNLRRIYDNLALKTMRLRKTLQEIYDGMKSAGIESEKPQLSDNEFTRKIRGLENKLDTSMIKYNEAQGIKKTYEQIVYRLRDERFGFENQLSLTERQLHAKQRDYDELLLLSNEAFHAKEVAYTELEDHRKDYEDGRKTREKELREKHQIVQLRKQLVERNQQRESLRQKLIENDKKEKSLALYNAIKGKSALTEKLQIRNKIDIFEEAFRKIKETTGVSNVNEVITKIISQGDSTENLIAQSRENQIKIESLHQQYRKYKVHVEDLKFASSSSGQYRKLLDDQQEQLNTSQIQLDMAQETFESLSRALITLKSGVGHLQDILDPLRVDFTSSVRQAQQSQNSSSSAYLRITEKNNNNDKRNSSKGDDNNNGNSMALVSFDNDNSNTARTDSRMNTSRKITDLTDETVAIALHQSQRMIAHLLSILNPSVEHSQSKQLPLITDNTPQQQQQASKPFKGAIATDEANDENTTNNNADMISSDHHHNHDHDTITSSHHHHHHHHSPSSTQDHHTITNSNFTAHTVGEEGGQGEGDVTGLTITTTNSTHNNTNINGNKNNNNNNHNSSSSNGISNNNNNTSLNNTTTTTAASATAVLAIEEDIQEYMARTKYGSSSSNNNNHSQLHHQSSSLDDDFNNAHNNTGTNNSYNNSNTKNNSNNNITLNAFGMKVRPSNANNTNDEDNEDEEEDTNKNKRIDVKRASAEILRKMEQKQRQELQIKLKNEQQKSNKNNSSPPKSKGKA